MPKAHPAQYFGPHTIAYKPLTRVGVKVVPRAGVQHVSALSIVHKPSRLGCRSLLLQACHTSLGSALAMPLQLRRCC